MFDVCLGGHITLRMEISSLVLMVLAVIASTDGFRSVCYYTNWSQYRQGKGKFVPENVDPTLCTHLIYAFGKPEGTDILPFEWNDDSTPWSKGMYERATDLKQRNPNLKVLLAIGGYNMASEPFTTFVGSAAKRTAFVQSAISFLRARNFDGLDMDWEYPGQRGSPPEDKHNLVLLIQEMWNSFHLESLNSQKPRLLLTGALPAGKESIDAGYDIPAIMPFMDFISLMTYDFHGSWEPYTGMNSPLFAHETDVGNDTYLNLDWAAQYYVTLGAPRDKINIGIATYGRSFLLDSLTNKGVRAPASKPGDAGTYTMEKGFVSYYEVCDLMKSGAQVFDVKSQRNRYLLKGNFWVGYDDIQSVTEKACYTKQNRFGGVMFWALDLDDFNGNTCDQGRYPLMNAALKEMGDPSTARCPVKSSSPTSQTPQSATSAGPNQAVIAQTLGEFNCVGQRNDFYADPVSCSSFYVCADHVPYKVTCAMGMHYNEVIKSCDYAYLANCHREDAAHTVSTTPHSPPITVTTGTNVISNPCSGVSKVMVAHPDDCHKYFYCGPDGGSFLLECQPPLVFNPSVQMCDLFSNYPCTNPHKLQ
ncbi:unnamed protein product [Lymnaea stagnalis]|uniref:Chitinase n=1 Tax=Lymnaea stagnalis TaxID=6523 RepID=A0AAV2H5N5_LYMST